MPDKDALMEKIKKELDTLSDEVKKLESKMNDLGEEAKVTYKKQIDELQNLYQTAETKFELAKDVAEDKWDDVKENVEVTRKALKNSYNYFLSHYKKKGKQTEEEE